MSPARTRWRLALGNLLVFGVVLVATVVAAAFGIAGATDAALDRDLTAFAARAAARAAHTLETTPDEAGEHDDAHGGGHHREASDDDDDDHDAPFEHTASDRLVLLARRGEAARRRDGYAIPEGLPDEAAIAAVLSGERDAVCGDGRAGGQPVRVLTVPVRAHGAVLGAVQVAQSLTASERTLWRSIAALAATGAAGLLLAAIASAFLAGRAMRPITDTLARQQRFLADASHELRTPVAVLRARVEALLAAPAAVATREDLDRLRTDTEGLSALLSDLLDLARLDAGAEALKLEAIALGDAAEELVEALGPLAAQRGVVLEAEAAPIFVRAHLGRVRQALRVLVDNALKHTPRGGRVTVSVAREGPRGVARVSDDGPGIAPEHLPHVFERFYRADAARSREADEHGAGGAGLGLAIASELAERMHGTLTVTSEPGRGAVFTLSLPLA